MTLRQKTWSILIGGFSALVITILFILSIVLPPRFEAIAQDNFEQNMLRVRDALALMSDMQTQKISDWAFWDDAYQFVEDRNERFLQSNLQPPSLRNLKVNYIAFFKNETGSEITSSSWFPKETKSVSASEITKYIESFHQTYYFQNKTEKRSEVALIGEHPFLITALPVLRSDSQGTIKGFIVFASVIDKEFLKTISQVTHLRIKFFSLKEFDPAFKPEEKISWEIQTLNHQWVRGRVVFKDMAGRAALGVETFLPRLVYQEGEKAKTLVLTSLLFGILLTAALILFTMERSVLSRILKLEANVSYISTSGDLNHRVPVPGKDEISKLSVQVNKMLFRMQRSKRALSLLLDNADQGFFAVDSLGKVQHGFSLSVKKIFNGDPLGQHIGVLLGIAEQDCTDLLNLVFQESLDFQSAVEIWPKECNIQGRYIRLDYKPIRNEQGQLLSLMIVMTDITEVLELAKAQELERKRHQCLIKILHSKNYFLEIKELVDSLSEALQNSMDYKRNLHTIKGGLSFFDCDEIVNICHHWETHLLNRDTLEERENSCTDLKTRFYEFIEQNNNIIQIKPDHSKTLPVKLEDLQQLLVEAQTTGVASSVIQRIEYLAEQEPSVVLSWLSDAFVRTSEKLGKMAQPIEWLPSVGINGDDYDDLFRSLIHVVRNAADHGIEFPEERELLNKSLAGHIQAQLKFDGNFYIMTLKDDGAGVNLEKIVVKAKKLGLPTPEKEEHILDLLFHEGFSTKSEVSATSGRGVGLDAVRTEARRLGGDVKAESTPRHGLKLTVWFKKRSSMRLGGARSAA